MTSTETLNRIEQAMLGSMIARPAAARGLPVTADLFTDPRHQAICAALTGTAGEERGLFGRLWGLFARFGRRSRETSAYMDELPGLCPDVSHLGSYFEILQQARAEREAAVRQAAQQVAYGTQVLAGAADQLDVQLGRARETNTDGELSPDIARLARALAGTVQQYMREQRPVQAQPSGGRPTVPVAGPRQQGQARGVQGPTGTQQPRPVQPRPGGQPQAGQTLQGQANGTQHTGTRRAAGPRPGRGPATMPAQRPEHPAGAGLVLPARPEEVQDLILAGMMRHPEEARQIAGWMPQIAFDAGRRRELFGLLTESLGARRQIDPLLMAYAADQRQAAGPRGPQWAADEGWATSDFVARTAARDVRPGTAAVFARLLLADRAMTARRGADWPTMAPRTVYQPGTTPAAPQAQPVRQPEPAQATVSTQDPVTMRAEPEAGGAAAQQRREQQPTPHGAAMTREEADVLARQREFEFWKAAARQSVTPQPAAATEPAVSAQPTGTEESGGVPSRGVWPEEEEQVQAVLAARQRNGGQDAQPQQVNGAGEQEPDRTADAGKQKADQGEADLGVRNSGVVQKRPAQNTPVPVQKPPRPAPVHSGPLPR